ncbi:helix-turn-helix domain-containing protein [Xylanimonas sp. McL0601]|uniref:helix-turn-helix domain-containing protein n=1 Tax=Xylanimonas sp. McL0601 TaxID=3414739 RepID=UPI003CEBC365
MLEVLGLDRWAEATYLMLVESEPLAADGLAARTGLDADALDAALAALEERGLVSRVPDRPVRYTALPPEHAVEVLLLAREREIQRVRALTLRLAERHRKVRAGAASESVIEVITGADAVARTGQQLLARAEHRIRGIDAPPYAEASDGQRVNSSMLAGDPSVERRFIHGLDKLRLPGATARVEADVAAGEDVRFLPTAPMKLILSDDQAALVPLVATPKVLDSCILVRPSALLDALSTMFETLWAQAQPYRARTTDGAGARDMSDDERRILPLLALGLADEAIARQLGIGHRTVQRRVQAILVRLGATSRFQAGVLAARRGWWDEPRA